MATSRTIETTSCFLDLEYLQDSAFHYVEPNIYYNNSHNDSRSTHWSKWLHRRPHS